jgi:hypothetical protein
MISFFMYTDIFIDVFKWKYNFTNTTPSESLIYDLIFELNLQTKRASLPCDPSSQNPALI